jgi:hypothetical protein
MKFLTFAAMAMAAILGMGILSGPALSDGGFDGRTLMAAANETATYEGELAIKEGHGDILVRADNGDQMRLTVKDTTIINRNGKPAVYGDLQSGDKLKVKYSSQDGTVIELNASGS